MKNYYPFFVAEGAKMMKRKNPDRIKHTDNFDRDFRSLFGCPLLFVQLFGLNVNLMKKNVVTKTFIMGNNVFKIVRN